MEVPSKFIYLFIIIIILVHCKFDKKHNRSHEFDLENISTSLKFRNIIMELHWFFLRII